MTKFTTSLKKLRDREKKPSKTRAFLYLNTEHYKAFQTLCENNGTSASKVVDLWIEEALEKGKK